MESGTPVQVKPLADLQEAVNKYLQSNLIWRAEDRDLVWSVRFVNAKLALLAGQQMTFGELAGLVTQTLADTSSPNVRLLTPDLIADVMILPTN